MRKDLYINIYNFVQRHNMGHFLKILNSAITAAVFLFYPILLVCLYFNRYADILKMVFVPLCSFLLLTVFRTIINAPRPYEVFGTVPLTDGKKNGKSFPSRHTFSCFIIALCCLHLNTLLGFAMLAAAAVLGMLRVVCGVHFIKDVIAAAIFAVLSYVIGFIII